MRLMLAALAILVIGTGTALTVDYWRRCHAAPLTKEEALERAKVRLETFAKSVNVGRTLPTLVDAEFDGLTNSWIVTYRNSDCSLDVIVDRCHGDDIGGVSAGCRSR